MPYTEDLFIDRASQRQRSIQSIMPRWYSPIDRHRMEPEYTYGFRLYENARRGTLGILVLGDESIRSDETLLANLGATSVEPTAAASDAIVGDNARLRRLRGAVLNERFWWPFFNDCWVLGGIHGGAEFHLGFSAWPDDSALWDGRNRRPTMLGRELFILSLAGYEIVNEGVLGLVFRCRNPNRAADFELSEIYDGHIGQDRGAFIDNLRAAFGP